MLRNFSDISLMSVDRSISSNLGQKAWVEPWLPLGQVHVYKIYVYNKYIEVHY